MLNLLYRSFDDELSAAENLRLDRALEQSVELRDEKDKIAQLRNGISGKTAPSFKPFFAERVTNRVIDISKSGFKQQDFFESLNFIFKRVAIVGFIAVIVLFSVNIFGGNSNINSYQPETRKVTLEEDFYSNYLTSMEEVL